MQGKRVEWNKWNDAPILNEGEYAKCPNGPWFCCAPGNHMGNLGSHSVVEHEDGTITVSPSILISVSDHKGNRTELFHGFLEKGIWRKC
jgi:hypothetical protein